MDPDLPSAEPWKVISVIDSSRHPEHSNQHCVIVAFCQSTISWLLLSLTLLAVIGCNPSDSWQIIDARIESSEIADSDFQGILTLSFDRPMLLPAPSSSGLQFSHPDIVEGKYRIEEGERLNEWRIYLESGFSPLLTRGEGSNADLARLTVNLNQILPESEISQFKKKSSESIVINPSPVEPAQLIGARWVDTDGSSTVNQEDLLVLEWDKLVSTGVDIHQPGDTFLGPDDLIRLPVSGDRLGDQNFPARWIASNPSMQSSLILGASPMLTIDGVADPTRYKYEGSSSGVALTSTSILPSNELQTSRGAGVAAPYVVDLEGDCDPWSPVNLDSGVPPLEGSTLTPLAGGRFLLAGGRTLSPSGKSRVLGEAWILNPRGGHIGPIPMQHPRKGHTASILTGEDGITGTADDLVLLFGGWDGKQVRNDAEVFVQNSENSSFLPVAMSQPCTPRFEHSAHVIADENEIVLVGGRLEGELNGIIEVIILEDSISFEDGSIRAESYQAGELAYPRHQHASVLLADAEDPLLFIYGGYGGSLGAPYVKFTAEYCRVLSAPEAFRIRRGTRSLRRLRMSSDSDLPGPRRSLRMLPGIDSGLNESSALLVAGTRKPPTPDPFAPHQTSNCRTGFVLQLKDNGRGYLLLEWVPVGRLVQETLHPGIAPLPGGRVLIVGGRDNGGMDIKEASIFDPVTGLLERVCKSLDHEPWQNLLTQQASPTWGGAFILGVDTQSLRCQGILFEASR